MWKYFEEVERSEMGGKLLRSCDLISVKYSIALISLKGHDEKRKIVRNEIQLLLKGL